jgi:hypothetical protein
MLMEFLGKTLTDKLLNIIAILLGIALLMVMIYVGGAERDFRKLEKLRAERDFQVRVTHWEDNMYLRGKLRAVKYRVHMLERENELQNRMEELEAAREQARIDYIEAIEIRAQAKIDYMEVKHEIRHK